MKKNLVCIICPRGCALEAEVNGEAVAVTGNACPKGEKYATDELTHPTRNVTSTVRISNRKNCMVSVKTEAPIAKEHIFDAMELIRNATAQAPINIGDIILKDVYGTNIIATKTVI